MNRRTFVGSACAAAAFVAAGPACAAATVLRVGTQPVDSSGQVFYAKELGMFEAVGLDVQITSMPNGQEQVTAVSAGALDIGNSAVGSVAAAREKGLLVKYIAPGGLALASAPTDVLMVLKDSPIQTGADFSGKVIAVNGLGNVIQYGTEQWIDNHGGDSKKVKWVEIPFPLMAPALQQHRVDAATVVEPFVSDAKNVARGIGSVFESIASRFMTVGWLASDAWLQQNAEVAARFITAVRRASVWANAHRKESAEILMRYAKIKPETLETMTRVSYSLDLTAQDIQPAINVGVKYGAIEHPMAASEIMWRPPRRV
ncbi:MAG TPA: ABC transporter substrate-binding protein [Candidatus Binatia bacterium]|nr:ABC transporter substrate-binding protein [Candidatus Binatia bacterium]